jgi:glycine cleavage system H lipoate-binding protein
MTCPVSELENAKESFIVLSPADGQLTNINRDALEIPNLISSKPETDGWIWEMKVTKLAPNLLSAKGYEKYCNTISSELDE